MLEPRDTDIWALFLVFVVLPLVSYFLLGKWSDTRKAKKRISFIAAKAVEEALLVEDMAVGGVIPSVSVPNNGFHMCARCFGTATTRCSQCKLVWYCSGRCQITHWRQVHKLECHLPGNNYQISSSKPVSLEGPRIKVSHDKTTNPNMLECNVKHPSLEKTSSNDVSLSLNPLTHTNAFGMTMNTAGKDVINHRSMNKIPSAFMNGGRDRENVLHKSSMLNGQSENGLGNVYNGWSLKSSTTAINGTYASDNQMDLTGGEYLSQKGVTFCDESKGVATIKDNIHLQGSNRVASLGVTRMMGLMKSAKPDYQQSEDGAKKLLKVKMLFPYEEFMKCFQLEILNLSPRGLVNCGNSCYANAALQCLTFTKPLITYLLRQSHSKAGCAKDWCLICELEQHVTMLRETGYPISPGNILMHIRSLNSQIGSGSQEDAHEFLRLIIASMQSIYLESLGGEKVADPRLQDTTFIQHTFGGRLRSKVKCLRCHQESVRHENIMDLTLEIFGWVESLEDALTQFTSSEDLDGENMYRCGRCASYVRARKRLSIKEAPNILTIVLKRFQDGNYVKINKRITFPEILDMIPFMTGTDDIPPPYMLYAVVVHLNTSNESFSGHYISYVKDLKGNWFRVDDTEVQPVQLSQVMSEGAYILFYMRSHPRPARGHGRKATSQQTQAIPKNCSCQSKPEKFSKLEQCKLNHNFERIDPYLDNRLESNTAYSHSSRGIFIRENRSRPTSYTNCSEFSDAASSDWSLFTSSDDASFTTESTRDSFSTVDYSDALPFSSIFRSLYPAESTARRDIMCSKFLRSNPLTRFAEEQQKGFVSFSCMPTDPQK